MLSFAARRHFSLESLAWIGPLKSAASNDQVGRPCFLKYTKLVGKQRLAMRNAYCHEHQGRSIMPDEWEYQVRINVGDDYAEILRRDLGDPAVKPVADILSKHRATLKSQFDAFADYVSEAEKQGVEHYPLYKWTKVTIEDPIKKAKHLKSFTFYVEGKEVYAKAEADALEADLLPLVGGGVITKVSKHDTNPANNPQAPAHLR
jgi:hypothetical protein